MSVRVFVDGGWVAIEQEDAHQSVAGVPSSAHRMVQALTVAEALTLAADLVDAAEGDRQNDLGAGVTVADVLRKRAELNATADMEPMPGTPNGTDFPRVG